jgi:lactate dehydrogenase-like 2-hydroxyacid dehydrogenase
VSARPRIFVVQPIPQTTIDLMAEVADVEVYPYTNRMVSIDDLAAAAARSDYIFTMHETRITKEIIDANPNLKGIVYWAWDGKRDQEDLVDVEACAAAGVRLLPFAAADHTRARNFNAKATADLTVALMMCLAYRVIESDAYTRAGRFRQEMTMELMGVGCTDKVAGLIGLGVVARELVPRLRALDMDVLYTKRTRLPADEEADLGVTWVDTLDALIPASDYVCMMANYNPSAHMLMGAREFALMKPTAFFINTGRGRLVDEPAMIRALQDGTIAGAGLDVYWNEPPVVHDPFVPEELRRLHNVVLAPHNGGGTWDSRERETLSVANAIINAIKAS